MGVDSNPVEDKQQTRMEDIQPRKPHHETADHHLQDKETIIYPRVYSLIVN
jgi:hypothetical protein